MSQPAPPARPPSSRGNPSLGDILRSVVVLAVAILLVVWVGGWFRGDPVPEADPVDYAAAADGAAETATYPVLVPPGLPDGWRATRASWEPVGQQWRLGLLTAEDEYVGVEQSGTATEDELLETYAPDAAASGEVEVGGDGWRVFTESDQGRTSLVRSSEGVATLVTGSVPADEVEAFAAELEQVEPAAASAEPTPTDESPTEPEATEQQAQPAPEDAPAPRPVSIEALAEQQYAGGDLRMEGLLGDFGAYTRHAVSYRSNDGLRVTGVLHVPAGRGPFPAVVLAHGYIDPAYYVSGQGMSREHDYLAREGYVVLHTDYRNHAGSDDDPQAQVQMQLGYVEDVVNAVKALKQERYVDPERTGIMGRSMGGGIVYQALVAKPGLVDAGVTYASVSSRVVDNFERWTRDSDPVLTRRILQRYGTPQAEPDFWRGVSSRPYFDRITEPVLAHHGRVDSTCPPRWARATQQAMRAADVGSRLVWYPGEGHTFYAQWERSMQRTVAFLDRTLAA